MRSNFDLNFAKLFIIFGLINLLASSAHAVCGLSLTANAISVNWTTSFTHIAVQLTIDKTGPDACDFGLGFTKGGASSYATRAATDGAKSLRYQLYKDSGLSKTLKDVPDITSSDDVVVGGFQAGNNMTQNVTYYFEIPNGLALSPSLVSAGTYTDTFTVNLYEGSDPLAFAAPPVDTENVSLSITVPQMIGLSLVNSGSGYVDGSTIKNISFGSLYQGQTYSIDFRVRTNAGFDVTFSSANNGNLAHVNPSSTSQVPYSLYVNGVLLNMSSSASVPVSGITGSGSTSMTGLAYPIKIVIGNVTSSGKMGGSHADVITVTATTTE